MRLREHPAIGEGRTDILPADPRLLSIIPGYNVRDLTTPEAREELDELKAKVKAHGVRTALVVKFDGEKIWIIEGHKRHKVAMELINEYEASEGREGRNIDFVPITAEKLGTSDVDRDYGLETSNSGARLKPLELANLIYRLNTQRGQPLEAIAEGLGKSLVVIKNHLAMRAMPENVKQMVGDGVASATTAAKAVKDAKNDPAFAAQLLQDAADEQKRLGKKGRATPKALKAASERAKPKPPAETKATPEPEASAPLASGLPATPETEGAPISGVESLVQLQEQIAGLTAPSMSAEELREYHRPPDGATAAANDRNAEQQRRAQEFEAAAPKLSPASTKADVLIFKFMSASLAELAAMFASLNKEHDEATADDRQTVAQIRLIRIADEIGALHFEDDWQQAKANTEMEYA